MEKEYDFSKGEQAKFYTPVEELEIPIYLEKEVEAFFARKAMDRKLDLKSVINTILRKEMELLKAIG